MDSNALDFIFFQLIFLVLRNNFDLMMDLLGHRRQPHLQFAGDGTEVDDEDLLLLSSLLAVSRWQYRTPPCGQRITWRWLEEIGASVVLSTC
jgi:hypothetical protein